MTQRGSARKVLKLFRFLEKLRKVYPDFYCEYNVAHQHKRWILYFQLRGSIPWRDKRYTFSSKEGEPVYEFLSRSIDMIKDRVDPLRKRM